MVPPAPEHRSRDDREPQDPRPAGAAEVTVNGAARRLPDGMTVAALVEDLGYRPGQTAVERNRQVVPRAGWAEVVLEAGDEIEVVTLQGGG